MRCFLEALDKAQVNSKRFAAELSFCLYAAVALGRDEYCNTLFRRKARVHHPKAQGQALMSKVGEEIVCLHLTAWYSDRAIFMLVGTATCLQCCCLPPSASLLLLWYKYVQLGLINPSKVWAQQGTTIAKALAPL